MESVVEIVYKHPIPSGGFHQIGYLPFAIIKFILANFVEQISHHILMGLALHQVTVLGVDHQLQWMMART
jgi:hypothetical protein